MHGYGSKTHYAHTRAHAIADYSTDSDKYDVTRHMVGTFHLIDSYTSRNLNVIVHCAQVCTPRTQHNTHHTSHTTQHTSHNTQHTLTPY